VKETLGNVLRTARGARLLRVQRGEKKDSAAVRKRTRGRVDPQRGHVGRTPGGDVRKTLQAKGATGERKRYSQVKPGGTKEEGVQLHRETHLSNLSDGTDQVTHGARDKNRGTPHSQKSLSRKIEGGRSKSLLGRGEIWGERKRRAACEKMKRAEKTSKKK